MKKIIIIASILLATSAYGMGGRPHNIQAFGSDDNQHGGKGYTTTIPVPDNPTPSPVPEPTTLLLFGAGLVGIAAYLRKR